MRTRRLGHSDLDITVIGFGAWAIGGGDWLFGWGPQDDADSVATIRRAIDLGINWVDTAAVYGLGHSEQVVARALAEIPAGRRPYVFTKSSLVWDEHRKVSHSLRADSIRREVEGSLQRLGVEVIDLYQIHWPRWGSSPAGWDPGPIEEGWQAMADLQKAGKVRYIGASNFTRDDLARAEAVAPVTSLQPPYSLLRRDAEDDLFPWCLEHGTGVIVYSPMQSGLLTGTMTRERLAALARQRLAAEGQVLPGAVPDRGAGAGGAAEGRRRAPRPLARRSGHRVDAAPSRRHRGHRRRAACRSARRDRRRRRRSS